MIWYLFGHYRQGHLDGLLFLSDVHQQAPFYEITN
jgi:hypothetical protein